MKDILQKADALYESGKVGFVAMHAMIFLVVAPALVGALFAVGYLTNWVASFF